MKPKRVSRPRAPRVSLTDAIESTKNIEQRSTEMDAYLTEMAATVAHAAFLYQEVGFAILAEQAPSAAEAQAARSAGKEAEQAVHRFQHAFHNWLSALDRAWRVGRALQSSATSVSNLTLH